MAVQNEKLERMFDSDSRIMFETLRRMLGAIDSTRLSDTEVERAFRAAHSIKSEAGFLGIDAIASSAHGLEDRLSRTRLAAGVIDDALAGEIRRSVGELGELLEEYRTSKRASEPAAVQVPATTQEHTGTRSKAQGPTDSERSLLREARRRGERVYRIGVEFACEPELQYPRAFLVVNNLELASAVIRTDPSLDELEREGAQRLDVVVTTGGDSEALRRAVHVDQVDVVELREIGFDEIDASEEHDPAESALATPAEVASDRTDELALFADEIVATGGELESVDALRDNEELVTRVKRIVRLAGAMRARLSGGGTVELLDLIRDLIGTSTRYAAQQGKRLRVEVGGSGAHVALVVGDTLLEVVMHLIRNAIDHGIGNIEARAKAGRPPAATIRIGVEPLGDRVRIVVQDDGEGIDEASVRARAGDDARALLDILSRPGFSTRDTADTGSGRGVGLDTVIHSIRMRLGGDVRLVNAPGRGVTFVLVVPRDARLIHVLVAESASRTYAVPRSTVIEQRPLDTQRVRRDSFGSYYYDYHGETMPLSTVTGRTPGASALGRSGTVLVTRGDTDRRALLVDRVIGEEAIVRDDARAQKVYLRTLGQEAVYVFPGAIDSMSVSGVVSA